MHKGVILKRTRYPTDEEEKYIRKCMKAARVVSYIAYGLAFSIVVIELIVYASRQGTPFIYLTGVIGVAVCFIFASQRSQTGQAEFEHEELVEVCGILEAVSGYNTDYELSSIPLIPSSSFAKVARHHRGEELTIEGYLSEEGGVLYELAVPDLNLSVKRSIEEGEITV